jgi:hypothetical protein
MLPSSREIKRSRLANSLDTAADDNVTEALVAPVLDKTTGMRPHL